MQVRALIQCRAAAACLLAALISACGAEAPKSATSPLVELNQGKVRGEPLNGGGKFLGVPFANPPTGQNRWAPPQAVSAWSGIFDATRFAPACMQGDYSISWYADLIEAFGGNRTDAAGPVGESEDCLYLNIWSPSLDPDADAPVMIWIHGGGYRGGWSYEPNYIGDALAAEGVVVVSIAYRLGPFGYIGPDGATNLGLMDQIAAIEWVRDNIQNFGGNPENVTLFGESAGASSIGTLIVTPTANSLFQRAIHQSGGFEFIERGTNAEAQSAFEELSRALSPEDPLAVSSSKVLATSERILDDHWFTPVTDGVLLPAMPSMLLESGTTPPIDLMIGTNADEWLSYLTAEDAEANLAAWSDRLPDAREEIQAIFDEYGVLGALDQIETAHQMRCPGRMLSNAIAETGGNVFVYQFTRVRPGQSDPYQGSYHGAEIPYVFDKHDDWLPTDSDDRDLTDTIMQYWVNFAKTGDPNGPGLAGWQRHTPGATQIQRLGQTVGPMDDDVSPSLCAALRAAQ